MILITTAQNAVSGACDDLHPGTSSTVCDSTGR
jgi:hypothetical protein